MEIIPTEISDVKKIVIKKFEDSRGFFGETFNQKVFSEAGLPTHFVQDNTSYSSQKGTIRGLHYQIEPMAQDKIIWVLQGSIFDVALDLRKKSSTFGKYVEVVLSAEKLEQLLIPAGFAHGFCTLQPETVVAYKVTNLYSPEHERGIRWNDPVLNIQWPVDPQEAIVSEKDSMLPLFADAKDLF